MVFGFTCKNVRIPLILTSLCAAVMLGGCGEIITYSKQSRAKGEQYLQANQQEEAIGAFRDAVRQNPRDYESYYQLGVLYDQQKQYADAIGSFKTSLDVQNVTEEGRDDVSFKLKTIDAFAKTLARADARDVEINAMETRAAQSTTGDVHFVLARVYVERGDADSAMSAYAKAAQKSPELFYIAKEQGLFLERLSVKPDAIAALTHAYQLDDKDVDVMQALRRLGVVPGPALKDEKDLARPLLPKGPMPDLSAPAARPAPSSAPPESTSPVLSPTPIPAD
jgi:tetratricopeptide (TPR) repeat protein